MATASSSPSPAAAGTFRIGGDLPVARLGFGAMRVTGEGVWGPPDDREEALRVLRRAVELGVTLIDTADSYGPNVSEELIAAALHPYPDELVIATKGGLVRPGPDDWEPNGRPEHLRRACEGSLRRLKTDRIDLYQLHRPDPDVPLKESLGALVDLQTEGKIRLIGVSNVDVDELRRAREVTSIASVQNRFNLEDREAEPVLDACAEAGIAFLPWYPLAAGPLAKEGGAAARIAERHDATPAQVALAWLLARSPVVLPIPGTSSVEHLEENVAAVGIRLSHDEVRELAESSGGGGSG
jgi:aryl-alcohol dehydrogenase-like predicted oxidoreductase